VPAPPLLPNATGIDRIWRIEKGALLA
jgi:hypothetical protein